MSQALVPLSTLVTSGSGTQRVLDTWLTLLSRLPVPQPAGSRRRRQDSVADAGRPMGQLHVQLQLVLPGETLESDVSDASDQDRMSELCCRRNVFGFPLSLSHTPALNSPAAGYGSASC